MCLAFTSGFLDGDCETLLDLVEDSLSLLLLEDSKGDESFIDVFLYLEDGELEECLW